MDSFFNTRSVSFFCTCNPLLDLIFFHVLLFSLHISFNISFILLLPFPLPLSLNNSSAALILSMCSKYPSGFSSTPNFTYLALWQYNEGELNLVLQRKKMNENESKIKLPATAFPPFYKASC